jgi:secreted PhoX family phosphatase
MGRFSHEAVAIDQRTGVVYLTEDAGSRVGSGLYRFLPTDPANLSAGGTLEMLGLSGILTPIYARARRLAHACPPSGSPSHSPTPEP